ncbi:MAG: ATP-binding protein, partial [Myxococcota bacterium]
LRVLPVSIDEGSEPAFLVLFHPHAAPPSPPTWVPRWVRSLPPWSRGRTADVTRLEAELATTRAYLQTVIEDHDAAHDVLLAANEEVQSGNEELQSTNEELETAKEELQSVNEELLTVNEQLHGRNNDLMALSDDLTNLLGSAVVSMVALDGALAIRRFTPAAAQVLGLRQSDVGRPLQSLALPIGAPDLPEVCAQVAVHDGVVEREVRHDGGRWYTLRVHPYRATDGHTDGAVVVLVDIDDAKRAQDQLRDARDYVTAIVETVRHPLVVLDGELRVQSANRAFYQRFRLTAGACEGERVSSLGVEWLEGSAGASLLERLWRGDTLVDHEVAHGAGPERRTWSVNGRRLVGAGEPRVLLAIEDVSDARRLAAELELRATELAAADARKNEFLAVLAHELRNPLVPIRNGLEILRLSDGDPPTVHRTHRMLERQVRHMTRLVDDLLDVSRIGLGRITLRRRQVDLCAVVRQLVELEQPLIERASHQVEVSTPPEGVVVYADPVRLDQIVDNLLANAIKYTDPGGHIRITVSAEGGTASLEVADDGVGISAELEPRLWDLFSQADWTADRGGGGLGIGLALVRRLVGLHGGSVEAHSDGAGTGSRFVVHLPLSPHPFEVDVSEADIPRVVGGAPGRRVLVVDDDLDVAQSMATLLELMGHEVRVAHDGAGALAAMADPTPEVVFLDIGMAGVSGLEVARLIRAGHRFGRPYLVALTGYGAAEDLARTHAAGFDLHLVKPVEPARLEEVLASLPTTLGVR